MQGGVFISYRRGDGSGFAGRVYDRLVSVYGPEKVFLDVDNLEAGQDFVTELTRSITACDIMLVLIGPAWASAAKASGERRLADPDDFVRIEIETALKADKAVVPLLIDSAEMPPRDQLPESLWPLLRRHAIRLSHESFSGDAARLLGALAEIVQPPRGRASARQEDAPARRVPLVQIGLIAAILLAIIVMILAARYVANPPREMAKESMALVELWETPDYQAAQAAVRERLARLNQQYAGLLSGTPTEQEKTIFISQVGRAAMREDGGTMPLPEFKQKFDLLVRFFNRVSLCAETSICDSATIDAYFGDFLRSFYTYFGKYLSDSGRAFSKYYVPPKLPEPQ